MTLTLQQMFDVVLTNLTTQGVASTGRTNPEGDISCQYRGTNGRKCAAGWLLADEHYTRELEGQNSSMSIAFVALVKSGVPDTAVAEQLVGYLQSTHDTYMPGCGGREKTLHEFHMRMLVIANLFGLTFNLPAA